MPSERIIFISCRFREDFSKMGLDLSMTTKAFFQPKRSTTSLNFLVLTSAKGKSLRMIIRSSLNFWLSADTSASFRTFLGTLKA